MNPQNFSFVFFGTPDPAVEILEELNGRGIVPALIVTNPDKPQCKKHVLTPSPVKAWADEHSIPTLQPEKLNETFIAQLAAQKWDLFIIVAYGMIMPKAVLDIPKHGSI